MTAKSDGGARAVLLIQCPDRPGIVAAISTFLFSHGANIIESDQHSSGGQSAAFFMRLEFEIDRLDLPLDEFRRCFDVEVGTRFGMSFRLTPVSQRKSMALLVSKHDHALLEILWQWRRGDLRAEVRAVISNHPDLAEAVQAFGVPFFHVANRPEIRAQAEARIGELVEGVDLIVLARYMQVVSGGFVERFANRIVNIHHSFLPAFAGADPYTQASEHGVKIIGATAHYVTADLDAGPIIDQDVVRVSHRHTVEGLKYLGRDLERRVLARAVRWHCEERILVHENKTIVFA